MSDNSPTRLLILSADADLALGVARCLAPGPRPDAVIAEPAASICLSRFVRRTHTVPKCAFSTDRDRLLDLIVQRCTPPRDWMVVPVDYEAHLLIAEHARDLHGIRATPVADSQALRHLNDKAWLAEFAASAGIATPKTIVVRSPEPPSPPLRFPVLAKPACGSGGRGIRRADDARSLAAIVAEAAPSDAEPVVLQEVVEGDDVGVNVLAESGRVLAWSVQRHLPRRILRFEAYDAAVEVARRLIEATNYTGVAHIDFIDPPGSRRPLLLECNPRFWASLTAARHVGANYAALAVRLATEGSLPAQTEPIVGQCRRAPCEDRLRDPLPYLYGRWTNALRHLSLPYKRTADQTLPVDAVTAR